MVKSHTINEVLAFGSYPINEPNSTKYLELLQRCQAQLDDVGAAELPNFLTETGLLVLIDESRRLAKHAYFNAVNGNPYLEEVDKKFPQGHPRRMTEDTSLGVVAYDEYPESSLLKQIYEYEPLMQFIGDVLELKSIFRYADPMGGLNLSVMKKNDYLRWHFDQTDFVTSLAIQSSEVGGDFEFVPMIRSKTHENYEQVSSVLQGQHPGILRIANKPGTLLLFKGRYSIHRVSTILGQIPRLMGLLAYDERPGIVSTDHLRQMRYGRTKPITRTF